MRCSVAVPVGCASIIALATAGLIYGTLETRLSARAPIVSEPWTLTRSLPAAATERARIAAPSVPPAKADSRSALAAAVSLERPAATQDAGAAMATAGSDAPLVLAQLPVTGAGPQSAPVGIVAAGSKGDPGGRPAIEDGSRLLSSIGGFGPSGSGGGVGAAPRHLGGPAAPGVTAPAAGSTPSGGSTPRPTPAALPAGPAPEASAPPPKQTVLPAQQPPGNPAPQQAVAPVLQPQPPANPVPQQSAGPVPQQTTGPVVFNERVGGTRTFEGPVKFEGGLSPGNSPGLITLVGGLAEINGLHIEIGGLLRGTEYDAVDGDRVAIRGLLDIDLIALIAGDDPFAPVGGEVFDIIIANEITGAFESVDFPVLAAGLSFAFDLLDGVDVGGVAKDIYRLSVIGTMQGSVVTELNVSNDFGIQVAVPAPPALPLLLVGLTALAGLRRRA